jgi:hypothetical protein
MIGYRGCISALDAVYAITALLKSGYILTSKFMNDGLNGYLESMEKDEYNHPSIRREQLDTLLENHIFRENEDDTANEHQDWISGFWTAYDALMRPDLLNVGISLAKILRRTIVRQAISIIEKRAIRTLSNFRFTVLRDGSDLSLFTHPMAASQLALFLLDAIRVGLSIYIYTKYASLII